MNLLGTRTQPSHIHLHNKKHFENVDPGEDVPSQEESRNTGITEIKEEVSKLRGGRGKLKGISLAGPKCQPNQTLQYY